MNHTTFVLVGSGIFLTLFFLETAGSPVVLSGKPKPPNCPHGECFIDKCERICSCLPPQGSTMCNKNKKKECDQTENTDNCPLGQTYRSKLWADNFLCLCNNDASQTYECLDLSRKIPAPADIVNLLPTNKTAEQILANGGKRQMESKQLNN